MQGSARTPARRKGRLATTLAAAVFAASAYAPPTSAAPQTVDIAQARQIAVAAYNARQPTVARDLAKALLARDPGDMIALQVLSGSEYALGNHAAASEAAARAWRAADRPAARYDAARLAAEAEHARKHHLRAQFWLRRAIGTAPEPALRDEAVKVLQAARRKSPLAVQFSFGLSPTSNINNGSASDRLILFGLPFEISGSAKALSGVEGMIGAAMRYRIAQSPRRETALLLMAEGRAYRLSDNARALAPEARASDYASAVVQAGVEHRWLTEGASGPFTLGVMAGRNWYGGKPLANTVSASLGRTFGLSPRTAVDVRLGAEHQARLDTASRTAEVYSLSARWLHESPGGDFWSAGARVAETQSRSSSIDHRAVRLSLDYTRGQEIAGLRLGGGLAVESRDFALSPYSPDGREDLRLSGSISAQFMQAGYLGFSPVLEVFATRNRSNIALFDTRETGVRLSIRSSF